MTAEGTISEVYENKDLIQKMHRIALNLPERVYERIKARADSRDQPVSEAVKAALFLMDRVLDEETKGRRLAFVDEHGKVLPAGIL